MPNPNAVVHWELCAKNGSEAVKFYSELFGWPMTKQEGMDYHLINSTGVDNPQAENGPGIGGGISGMPDTPPYLTVYVAVDDLQAYLDKAEALGGKTIMPPMPIPGMEASIAMFSDPQGQMIGLYKG
jgi:predicted enzyme related to lactoylglutathione lyase